MSAHPSNVRLVRIKETDKRLHIVADEIYEAMLYPLDNEKLTLLVNILSRWEPECNVYKHQVEVLPYWKH